MHFDGDESRPRRGDFKEKDQLDVYIGMKTTTAQSYRVLLADDQADIRASMALMDLNYARDTTSGQEGLDLLTRIQVLDSTVPVVVMTAWSSIELAVEAMRRGARDFIAKPWENNR